jgi:hypothetical protein
VIAIVLPGNTAGVEVGANAGRRGRRKRERGVVYIVVDVRILAVTEKPRVVIVQQVVVAGFATWVDADGLQIGDDRPDARLCGIRAIAV